MKTVEMLLVKDESNRYLDRWLSRMDRICDEIVVLDNGSTDDTVEKLRLNPKVKVVEVCDLPFAEYERDLRYKLFQMAMSREPDWIMAFDADEFVEDRMNSEIVRLIGTPDIYWWSFRFYHFWGDENNYRIDKLWNPQVGNVGSRMMKVDQNYPYAFFDRNFGCGSIPINWLRERKGDFSGLRIRHLGYAREEDIKKKGLWYLEKDGGKSHAGSHIQSILDEHPVLEEWTE